MTFQSILLLLIFCICGETQAIPNLQCSCQQIITEQECSNWNCQWITTSQDGVIPQTGYCQQIPCSQLNQQQCQDENERCYYQASTSQIQQVCYNFEKCENIVLSAQQTCQQANIRCVSSQSQQNKCQEAGQQCFGLSQVQCSGNENTIQTMANEGLCFWNGSYCQVVNSCSDILNEQQCIVKVLQHTCYWTNDQCLTVTCQQFQTEETCRFIQTNAKSNSLIQPCFWNGENCINEETAQLQQYNCAINTNYHYRWVPIDSINGICASCNTYQLKFRNQCQCSQLLQEIECNNDFLCMWTGQTCLKRQCQDFAIQQQCFQIRGCYWNITAIPSICEQYSTCDEIKGKNTSFCVQSSIYCPGSNGNNCQSQDQMETCQDIYQKSIEPNLCYNSVGKDGYCTYNIQNNTCSNISNCSQLNTKQLCNQFSNTCIWKAGTTNQCQQKTCQDYKTQISCTYIQNNINNNAINLCSWNSNTLRCNFYDNSINFDINSCYTQTGGTHHWSQPKNAQKGLCLPCNYSSAFILKSTCKCADFLYYFDCASSYPQCYWDYSNQTCQNQSCSQLTSQAQCVLSENCYWNQNLGCQNLTSLDCSQLIGYTQQECLSQSILCPGISKDGKCSSSLNSCNVNVQYYQCFGSVGNDGICQWNQNNQSCSGISSCAMIMIQQECQLAQNTCYWDTGSTTCKQYNCSSLYNITQTCNYFLTKPNQNYEIQMCSLNQQTCSQTSDVANLSSQNCYSSSGRIARWNSISSETGACQLCYTQLISFVIISLISIY